MGSSCPFILRESCHWGLYGGDIDFLAAEGRSQRAFECVQRVNFSSGEAAVHRLFLD